MKIKNKKNKCLFLNLQNLEMNQSNKCIDDSDEEEISVFRHKN